MTGEEKKARPAQEADSADKNEKAHMFAPTGDKAEPEKTHAEGALGPEGRPEEQTPPDETNAEEESTTNNAQTDARVCSAGPTAFSCDVCRDLLPLVADGVASADSEALVARHCAGCPACSALASRAGVSEEGAPAWQAGTAGGGTPNDAYILRRLKKQVMLTGVLLALGGVVVGAVLLRSTISAYLLWWLPLVGTLAFFALRRNWWFAPALVTLGVAAYRAVFNLASGWVALEGLITYPVAQGLQWGALTALGSAVGWLLWFAFGKEKKEEEKHDAL